MRILPVTMNVWVKKLFWPILVYQLINKFRVQSIVFNWKNMQGVTTYRSISVLHFIQIANIIVDNSPWSCSHKSPNYSCVGPPFPAKP